MADPTANFTITATDRTAAAVASAQRGLKNIERTVSGVRRLAGGLGIALSTRAMAAWMASALDVQKLTAQQIKDTEAARRAFAAYKANSDELARSFANVLAPAINNVAISMGLLRREFLPNEQEKLNDQLDITARRINALIRDIESARGRIGKTFLGITVDPGAAQAVENLTRQLDDLVRKRNELLSQQGSNDAAAELDFIDTDAIRAKRTEVMRSMPNFDVNAPTEAMRRRADQITQSMRTELEEQIATMREAESLASRGLISPETLQRLQDSMLQPIKVTAERMRDTNAERLASLMETFKSEEQLERDRYAQRLEDLQDLFDAEMVQREEFFTLKEELEKEHQDRMTEIQQAAEDERFQATKMHQQNTVDTIAGGLVAATAALASGSKRMFELNKKFAKAEAIINAHRAIQQVWADPNLPFYAKVAATAITAVRTAANIAAINATSFGGGTTPSAAGGATVNNIPVSQDRTITVRGIRPTDILTGRQLVELLNEATKDGAKLVLAN